MASHVWQNADFQGTRGWFVCTRCGVREHVPQTEYAPAPIVPPTDDKRVSYPPMTCDEVIELRATTLVKKVRDTLNQVTPTIREIAKTRLRAEWDDG